MAEKGSAADPLPALIGLLRESYGEIAWWPGGPEEVMIGAILTQQTKWENVERALDNLNVLDCCSLEGVLSLSLSELEEAIRCTGFFRIKSQRLRALSMAVRDVGGRSVLEKMSLSELREWLLSLHGVGPETADSILCYALNRPSYVIDAYTERICGCAGIPEKGAALKARFEEVLVPENKEYRLCHAWFVEYAKDYCGAKRCNECIVKNLNE